MHSSQFEEINARIQNFLQSQETNFYALDDDEYKLPLSDAVFCAMDTVRNRAFFEATQNAIGDLKQEKKEIHLVYAGSGTGILGIFALGLGADTAVFLEHNPFSVELSKKVVHKFGFSDRVEFMECDATKIELQKKYDLLISETLTSGFVREDFPRIVSHLRQFGNDGAVMIPERFEVEMGEYDDEGVYVGTQQFGFVSENGFARQKILLSNEATTSLVWKTTAFLYKNSVLSSGDSMSFLNRMEQDVEDGHPLFGFVRE